MPHSPVTFKDTGLPADLSTVLARLALGHRPVLVGHPRSVQALARSVQAQIIARRIGTNGRAQS
jgi:hypothetical protein